MQLARCGGGARGRREETVHFESPCPPARSGRRQFPAVAAACEEGARAARPPHSFLGPPPRSGRRADSPDPAGPPQMGKEVERCAPWPGFAAGDDLRRGLIATLCSFKATGFQGRSEQ